MLLAEFDPIQVAIIVIAMAAGFIQWLWKVIKQSIEDKKRADTPIDPEEKRLRDEAWRRQVQQQQASSQQTPQRPGRPSPTATPPPLHDPWSSVREVFEKMKEEMRQGQEESPSRRQPPPVPSRPSAPPQLPYPQRPQPGTVRTEMAPQPQFALPTSMPVHVPHSAPLPVPHAVRAPVVPRQVAAPPLIRPPRPDFEGLRGLLMTPGSLRQAILLKEVLGAPKSLQSSGDSPL